MYAVKYVATNISTKIKIISIVSIYVLQPVAITVFVVLVCVK